MNRHDPIHVVVTARRETSQVTGKEGREGQMGQTLSVHQMGQLVGVRDDAAPSGTPRQDARQHIHKVLREGNVMEGDTVGHGVAGAIEAIQAFAGENGARQVDTVFRSAALTELYKIPSNDPRAAAAHKQVAEAEMAYWRQQDALNSTSGTRAALSFSVEDRVALQQGFARAVNLGQQFTQNFAQELNPVGSFAHSTAPSVAPSSGQGATSTQPAGATYPGQSAGQSKGPTQGRK
jgi:hypothetical protein